ncbi:MAG: DUF4102 domain-containing protein, partial [Acetobacteraceae bacterium]|nr:DUF4102 domain-containing protein [Acetobacteraceae bacterium]
MAPRNKFGKQLTDAVLRNGQKGDIFREDGLEFRFFEKGQAGVRYVGRMARTNARLAFALGRYPTLSLKTARIAGGKARVDCKQGIDPR